MSITWYFDETELTAFDITGGRAIADLSSTYDMPAKRGDNPTLPMREGRLYVPKFYDQRVVTLGMYVSGTSPEDLTTNMDALKALLSGGQKLLERVDGTGATRQAYAEVTRALGFQKVAPNSGKVVVSFDLADPFFYSDTATATDDEITTNPQDIEFVHPGTAPGRKAVIVFNGPLMLPELTNTTNDVWVKYQGDVDIGEYIAIDCGAFTVLKGGTGIPTPYSVIGSLAHDGDPAFFRLDPGTNDLEIESSVTGGSVEISLYAPYL